jgi:predicted  nucleic acid-binding Zn-ribbon protein
MGFAFEEFPDADYYRSDLRAILRYIRKINAYLKTLDGIIEELRAGLERLDAIEEDVEKLKVLTDTLDSEVKAIKLELADIELHLQNHDIAIADLDGRIKLLEISINAIYQYIDDKYNELLAKETEDFNLLMLKLNQAKLMLQQQIDELRARIDSIDTDVYNPWIGRRVTLQENENFTYNHLADECLTAEQYLTLNYTAEEYANLQITSREYQEFGKDRTHFNWVFAPVYGFRQEISNVLTAIVNYLKGTMDNSQYFALDLTADEYAALDLTAEEYVGYNPFRTSGTVMYSNDGQGLTSNEYSHLTIT